VPLVRTGVVGAVAGGTTWPGLAAQAVRLATAAAGGRRQFQPLFVAHAGIASPAIRGRGALAAAGAVAGTGGGIAGGDGLVPVVRASLAGNQVAANPCHCRG